MVFSSVAFVVFFAVVLIVVALLRDRRWQIAALTVMSYVFYAASGPAFLPLLIGASVLDFSIGRALARATGGTQRRLLVALSVTANLTLLAIFKYAGFFGDNLSTLLHALGVPMTLQYHDVPLPPGISFYTFGAMSYTIDVYRRHMRPVQRPLDFFLFVCFFPHLVAGPILRASDFVPQLRTYRALDLRDTAAGLEGIAVGLFKKMVIADNLAQIVERGFTFERSPANVALVAVLFSVQIYCDFSGYTDVARGTARILGFHFPENFTWPYLSPTVQEFWRRWHRTLSFWIRDYVYIALGGSRVSRLRRFVNLGITWFLCGLWHGASWHFVLWGLFHGTFVELSRYVEVRTRAARAGLVVVTFGIVTLGWLLFRAPSTGYGLRMIAKIFGVEFAQHFSVTAPALRLVRAADYFAAFPYCGWPIVGGVALLAVVHYAGFRVGYSIDTRPVLSRLPSPVVVAVVGVIIAAAFVLSGPPTPFIYFAF